MWEDSLYCRFIIYDFYLFQSEPVVEQAIKRGYLNPNEKNGLNRQLTASILAHTDSPSLHARDHIAQLLEQKYPFLKGSFGVGHVNVLEKIFLVIFLADKFQSCLTWI